MLTNSKVISALNRAFDTIEPHDIDEDGKIDNDAVCEVLVSSVLDAIETITKLEAENARLRDYVMQKPCTCGLIELLKGGEG